MNEEQLLLESIENEEWTSVNNVGEFKQNLEQVAKNTMRKDQRMNIRISTKDLRQLKSIALKEGIPYQTLVTSIIHKYINDTLKVE